MAAQPEKPVVFVAADGTKTTLASAATEDEARQIAAEHVGHTDWQRVRELKSIWKVSFHAKTVKDYLGLAVITGVATPHDICRVVAAGANLNETWWGEFVLNFAICYCHITVVAALIEAGADVHAVNMERGTTPLAVAIELSSIDNIAKMELLLDHGASPSEFVSEYSDPGYRELRPWNETAVHTAARLGNLEALELFDRHIWPDIYNAHTEHGLTPLESAARAGKDRAVLWLLDRNAHATKKTLNSAITVQFSIEVICALLEESFATGDTFDLDEPMRLAIDVFRNGLPRRGGEYIRKLIEYDEALCTHPDLPDEFRQ